MVERLYPYVLFLPKGRKERVLRAIFGSSVPVDVLKFSVKRGLSEKIYQKDLIKSLKYSNKTIIEHLKILTKLGILKEGIEKSEVGGRTVWLKFYILSDLGRWFALLLIEEESLSREEKIKILKSVFKLYVRWIKEFSEKFGVDRRRLEEIFLEEIKK